MAGTSGVKLVLAFILLCTVAVFGPVYAKGPEGANSAATISIAEMPAQGIQAYNLIVQGGPFPYEKDGVVFGNRERLLPVRSRGFYREYTVKTPGSSNRGARRIVCGGEPRKPEACYYTADHYASFRRIVP